VVITTLTSGGGGREVPLGLAAARGDRRDGHPLAGRLASGEARRRRAHATAARTRTQILPGAIQIILICSADNVREGSGKTAPNGGSVR
jgi:hypothetical protein